MMELVNEKWRGKVNSCRIHPESENILVVESVVPADQGGFTIREMGIFDEDGAMIAVCNTPDTQKVRVTDGSVQELQLSMEIALSSTDSVELVVDPDVVMATKKDLQLLKISVDESLGDFREELERLAQFTEENRDMINGLQADMEASDVRLSLLELMYATDISRNPFTVTFGGLEGLVVEGIWNRPQKRIDF